jgi:hypothetical protein
VPGLEPTENADPDWKAKARNNLPNLPSTYSQKCWTAGGVKYMYGTSIERPKKGTIVREKLVDGLGWERDIWQA